MAGASVAVIDYDVGNLRSVTNALESLGSGFEIVADPGSVAGFDKLILPGVGAFSAAMNSLHGSGMADALEEHVATGKSLLGICLGMQLLCTSSSEDGEHGGFGWIDARVEAFPVSDSLKVPHMGWNEIHLCREDPIFEGIESGVDVYFVHSFHVKLDQPANTLASTNYGIEFTSIVGNGQVYGMQFHPEKSQSVGLKLLANYLAI